jgi:5-methylcytosine-specific restriction endonuclease McrA
MGWRKKYVLLYQLETAHIFQVPSFDNYSKVARTKVFSGTYADCIRRATYIMDDKHELETAHFDSDASDITLSDWNFGKSVRRDRTVLSTNGVPRGYRPAPPPKKIQRFRPPSDQELFKTRYQEYLKTDHWRATRQRMIEHFEHRCQLCNALRMVLHVHHRTYENLGRERDIDLTVLCERCHDHFHRIMEIDEHRGRRAEHQRLQPKKKRRKRRR